MDKSIYRYIVPFGPPQKITLNSGPRHVANTVAEDGLEFWAEHYPNRQEFEVTFGVFGTGWPVPDGAVYVGTASRTSDGLVFHLYEIPK
jgi:hypothetical protein